MPMKRKSPMKVMKAAPTAKPKVKAMKAADGKKPAMKTMKAMKAADAKKPTMKAMKAMKRMKTVTKQDAPVIQIMSKKQRQEFQDKLKRDQEFWDAWHKGRKEGMAQAFDQLRRINNNQRNANIYPANTESQPTMRPL